MPFTFVRKCPAFSPHFVVLSLTLLSVLLLLMLSSIDAIRCFTGFKFVRGQKFGGDETECKDDNEFCYNVTAEAGVIFKASKAGCSYYRSLEKRAAKTQENIWEFSRALITNQNSDLN
ncbi:hypothetical protein niasHT_009237 [Heterodera trifolii]|uniref:Uncharacterized protein n=1 Tax=Heterodera trifolii TaxID=157864 RepID=A0ABD2MAU7_9BILA